MDPRNAVELQVKRWSAWAPGLEEPSSWQAWADGGKSISGPVSPDVQFVDRLLRRRLSPLSRMAFRVATDCLEGEDARPISVFCSRYGEFSRAFEILSDLARDEPVSPMAFSLSVHNTASSLFAIMREDTSHSTALAAGQATLEAGFLECWSLLQEGAASTALLVYCDQVLPELYADQETTVGDSAALAFLLRLPRGEQEPPALGLSWRPSREAKEVVENPALRVLRLLLKGGEPIMLDSGRLTWTWSWNGSSA